MLLGSIALHRKAARVALADKLLVCLSPAPLTVGKQGLFVAEDLGYPLGIFAGVHDVMHIYT
jgi:hypothetical protein